MKRFPYFSELDRLVVVAKMSKMAISKSLWTRRGDVECQGDVMMTLRQSGQDGFVRRTHHELNETNKVIVVAIAWCV